MQSLLPKGNTLCTKSSNAMDMLGNKKESQCFRNLILKAIQTLRKQTLELIQTGSPGLHCLNSSQHHSFSCWSDPGRVNDISTANLSYRGLNFKQSNYLEKKMEGEYYKEILIKMHQNYSQCILFCVYIH